MRVLILSTTTGYQLRSFGEAAAELGIDLIFATDRCHALDDPWQDSAIPVRFYDEHGSLDAMLQALERRPVNGVIAVGDRPVVLAARLASALGMRGNPPDAARASAHKFLARERFARAGLPVPWYLPATVDDGLDRLASSLRYPAVVKPVGLSGSRGVIRVNDDNEFSTAFRRISALLSRPEIRAQRTGTEQHLLIEEYIQGREYAVEGLITQGSFRLLALFDKPDPLEGPFFEETIYVTPPAIGALLAREITLAVESAARALGLWHGAVHAECRVNAEGVFVLEVAARPIGGLCSRVLRFRDERVPLGATRSLEHLLLRHAVGDDVSSLVRESAAAAVMMIPIPSRGVFRSVRGEDDAKAVHYIEDVRITAKPDQVIEPLPESGSYLGFIFARAPRPQEAESAVREAHRRLTFVVDSAIDVNQRKVEKSKSGRSDSEKSKSVKVEQVGGEANAGD